MATAIWTVAAALLGIIGTIVTYRMNPKRQIYAELDSLAKREKNLLQWRDDALANGKNDNLNIAIASLNELHDRQRTLLQRLGKS